MGSSKSTARHIKQVASEPQAAHVNLMRQQRTDLPPSKSKQKQHSHKSRSKKRYPSEHKNERPPLRKSLIQAKHTKEEIDVQSVVIQSTLKVSSVLLGSSSARPAVNMVILQACATKSNHLFNQEIPRHISFK